MIYYFYHLVMVTELHYKPDINVTSINYWNVFYI